jgi:cysteinyl-tRNA synthetase
LVKEKNDTTKVGQLASGLKKLGGLLGLLQDNPNSFLQQGRILINIEAQGFSVFAEGVVLSKEEVEVEIEKQIQLRAEAKRNKDWVNADKIRDELKANGVILEDAPSGATTWRRE